MKKRRRIALAVIPVLAGASIGLWLSRPSDPASRMARELPRVVSKERILAELDVLAARPHRGGTPANTAVADEVIARLREAGYEPKVETHEVDIWEPAELTLSITKPEPLNLDLHERVLPEDAQSAVAPDELPYFAYSPDADVTAPVVYASFGAREDYELLIARGVDPRGKLALVRAQGICRGRKAEIAAEHGVRGLLIYPELMDQGFKKEPYPAGPHLNEHTAQRGSLLLYHRRPGPPGPDGAPLPQVPAIPLTPVVAMEILKRIEGETAPPDWTGWMPVPYRIGAGPVEARLVVRGRLERRPIRNVLARLPGRLAEAPPIVVGCHLDAWVYGAVDPTSGVQAVLETARVLNGQARRWWRPDRSVLFAFWDGEEYGMFGSTLWIAPRAAEPFRSLAAYVNVDSAVRSREFLGNVVPLLRGPLLAALDRVDEPDSGGRKLGELAGELQMPGFSSDTAPFSGLAGVPVAEVGFGRWYPVYHSVYDSIRWLNRFGDPGAERRAALVQVIGVYLASLTRGNVLPWRFSEISRETRMRIENRVREAPSAPRALAQQMERVRSSAEAHERSAGRLENRLEARRWRLDADADAFNAHLVSALGAFSTWPRPGFGNGDLLFGPSPDQGCAGERLPELLPAFAAGDEAAVAAAASRLQVAFDKSRRELEKALGLLER